MNKRNDSDWRRLEDVIRATGHNVNSFAKHIGFLRGENLYQIKRGNNGISRDVAERIHAKFPQYSVAWLMFGESLLPQLTQENDLVIRLPLYHDYSTVDFPMTGKPDDYLILSASAAHGAEIAVAYSDDVINPYLRDAYLLLKKHHAPDPILFGNIYLVRFRDIQLIRIVKKYELNPEILTLTTIQPSVLPNIDIGKEVITGLWRVVGAVCNLAR